MSIFPSGLENAVVDNVTRDILTDLSPLASMPVLALILANITMSTEHRFCPKTTLLPDGEYDFIVVGAGAGGATVAGRLSDCFKVLLLEAGGCPIAVSEIPAIGLFVIRSPFDWQFRTVPQKHGCAGFQDSRVRMPRGKMLGGTSNLNVMMYVRGNAEDYDDWERNGAEGWGYGDVLPYFKKSEGNRDPELSSSKYHNTTGELTVDRPCNKNSQELKKRLMEAYGELGYQKVDCNGPKQIGAVDHQGMVRKGQRCSTAKSFLVPYDNRPNLHIVKDAYVTKILIKDNKDGQKQAEGVEYVVKGSLPQSVRAKREVIVSAGTIKSPQLLMLSGIGPAEELQKFNIPVHANLPVGKNLHDHVGVMMGFENTGNVQPFQKQVTDANNVLEYHNNRTGPLSSLSTVVMEAFVNPLNYTGSSEVPRIQMYATEIQSQGTQTVNGYSEEVYNAVWKPYEGKPIMGGEATFLDPKSRGTITLNSADPHDDPLIDPQYLAEEDDLTGVVEAMELTHRIMTSKPMSDIGYKPFKSVHPGCENLTHHAYFRCVAKQVAGSVHHQVGTCKMGAAGDPTTVVDPRLRVKGIKNLRVVDASVMPKVPAGNTCAPTIMIAEKAADMIKEDHGCSINTTQDPATKPSPLSDSPPTRPGPSKQLSLLVLSSFLRDLAAAVG